MERMWLFKKISCEIQILNEKVGKLMMENDKLEKENKKLKKRVIELEKEREFLLEAHSVSAE